MLFKSLIESLLPPGSLWAAESGGDLDLLFDGIADCKLDSYEFLKRLAHTRDPQLTPMLDDLETEFGQFGVKSGTPGQPAELIIEFNSTNALTFENNQIYFSGSGLRFNIISVTGSREDLNTLPKRWTVVGRCVTEGEAGNLPVGTLLMLLSSGLSPFDVSSTGTVTGTSKLGTEPLTVEQTRRNALQTLMTSRNGTGRVEYLQRKLQQAGFLVNVYNNDPPVDPAGVVSYDPGTMCGEDGDLFGTSGEYFIAQGGELLVNGPIYSGTDLVEYEIPTDPVYWPFIFFIGGEVTRNGDGEIIGMTTAQVPFSRKQEFIRMIIRYKPLHTWVGVVVEYI